jgi:hypothetical protein
MEAASPDEIRAHVEHVCASSMFAGSERLCRFLKFTVESRLADRRDEVKEYVLGREVFDRAHDYDPRIDPIVRVEARRLRTKLQAYYDGPGRRDAIRMEYPKGSYIPVFSRAPAAPRVRASYPTAAAIVGIAALAAITIFLWQRPATTPLVAVVPEQWMWNATSPSDSRAIPLAEQLTGALANRAVAVVAWPLVAQHPTPGRPLAEISARMHASRIYAVGVHAIAGADVVTLFDIDPASGRKYRALQYATPLASFSEQRALALRMAGDLAQRSRGQTPQE